MNPNFKKKKPLPYKNLGELYIETAYHEPSISRLVSVLLEDSNIQEIKWEPFEKNLYDTAKLPENLTGTGPGEYSVAALLLKEVDKEKYDTLASLPDTELATIVGTLNNYVQGGEVSYDVEINNQQYEVKQTNDKSSVRTGIKAAELASKLFYIIKNNILDLSERYNDLSEEYKNKINKIVPDLAKILNQSRDYLKPMYGQLARGTLFPKGENFVKNKSQLAAIYKLPSMFEALLTDPDIEDIVSLTALEVKNIYNVDIYDAKIIDINARDYISNRYKNKDITVSDKTKFSDFLLMASESSFSSPEVFKNNILNYFIPHTDQHKNALNTILPITGLYVVSPESYIYVPKKNLDSVIRIAEISGNTLKIILQKQTSNA